MTFELFKENLAECVDQAQIWPGLPVVFHELQLGDIYIDKETGTFYFADHICNYIPSRLNLNNVANIRWDKYHGIDEREEDLESRIVIHFQNGDFIDFYYWHILDRMQISTYFKGENSKEECERMKLQCEREYVLFKSIDK